MENTAFVGAAKTKDAEKGIYTFLGVSSYIYKGKEIKAHIRKLFHDS